MELPSSWDRLIHRRDLLKIGSLSLASTLVANASADVPQPQPSADAIILLWMAGGVTHLDSFDPKPDAVSDYHGNLGTTQTTLPGVRFGEVMPRLADQTRHLAVLRS